MINLEQCWLKSSCLKYKNGTCPLQAKDDFCMKLFKLDSLYEEALISLPQRIYTPLRLDADNSDKESYTFLKQIEKNILDFISSGRSLYIYSDICGNGKTAWSLRLVQAYFNAIWYKCDLSCKALFINVPTFLLALKDAISHNNDYVQHIKDNILKADLIVWDDIATKTSTPFEMENLLSMIDARINLGKSNIYTSNICPSQNLVDKIGERLYSRIISRSNIVQFKGADKRFLARGNK